MASDMHALLEGDRETIPISACQIGRVRAKHASAQPQNAGDEGLMGQAVGDPRGSVAAEAKKTETS